MRPDRIRLKNINHITDNVKNKDAALRWDEDVLGLGWNAFEVDDIEAARAYMISRGVVPAEIQTRNDGQKAFYIHDPRRQPYRAVHPVRIRCAGFVSALV